MIPVALVVQLDALLSLKSISYPTDPVTAAQLSVAEVVLIEVVLRLAGALQVIGVVNCELAGSPVPFGQVADTDQLYEVP